jgi:DNA-binding response OmpR family regulator
VPSSTFGPIRIVIIARPTLGRVVAENLSTDGYEVYRTPSASNIAQLRDRIRPHLAIIALDLLGHDGIAAALELRAESHTTPVLLLGDATGDHRADDMPILSSAADSVNLRVTVASMLRASNQAARPALTS